MAIRTDELMAMIESLPVEIKLEVIERMLRSLHPVRKEIEELWAEEVERRLKELKTGKVRAVSAEDVFKEALKKYS